MDLSLAPRRCFCSEVMQESQRPGKLRVRGTLVEIRHRPRSTANPTSGPSFVLDDGSGTTAEIPAPGHMAQAVQVGQTLECVVAVRPPVVAKNRGDPLDNDVTVDTLLIHTHPEALSLGSLEILHAQQGRPGQTWGLPEQQGRMTSEDLARLIQAEAEGGVRLEEVLEMFRVEKEEVQDMIQELQMQGQIYQSKEGAYLPL